MSVGLCLAVLLSLHVGARITAAADVWESLRVWGGTDTETGIIVWEQRIPRTALAVVTGAALGVAGALIQGHTRNPLADPGILGVSAGAALGIVLTVYLFRVGDIHVYMWAALIGAALGSAIVFTVSAIGGGGANPLSLILAGAALTAFFGSVTTAIILMDEASMDKLRFWNAGSVSGRDLGILSAVAPLLIVGFLIALASGPTLNLLTVGTEVATGLGVNVVRARLLGFAAITLLAGGATAAVGPIGFLGLMVPHVVRAMTGPDYRWIVPASALTGSLVLVVADIVGRTLVRPGELQVGIVLALIGAPFFIALVRRKRLVTL
nr:iron chelate uptake ABC transporter family permease subunit [Corynebacterium sp. TAE3-ERU16]